MRILIVGAHPDDEVLGAGAVAHRAASLGHHVGVLILNSQDDTRYKGARQKIQDDFKESCRIIGVSSAKLLGYKDSEFHNAPHRSMVQDIESAIVKEKPNIVITHHPADINLDHQYCSRAVQEAVRYTQRGRYDTDFSIDVFCYMEVLSSSDWYSDRGLHPFIPDTFFKVDSDDIEAQIKALEVYDNVLRPMPFPRSKENIRATAIHRGAQCGYPTAQAFQTAFRRGML